MKMICTQCSGEFDRDVHQCKDCGAYLCEDCQEAHPPKTCTEFKEAFKDYV